MESLLFARPEGQNLPYRGNCTRTGFCSWKLDEFRGSGWPRVRFLLGHCFVRWWVKPGVYICFILISLAFEPQVRLMLGGQQSIKFSSIIQNGRCISGYPPNWKNRGWQKIKCLRDNHWDTFEKAVGERAFSILSGSTFQQLDANSLC